MWQITCGQCGKSSDANFWMETMIGTQLPPGQFQCPECKVAFRRKSGPATGFEASNGKMMIIPGKVTLERVPSYL